MNVASIQEQFSTLFDLSGQVAVVTGGGRGLGRAAAEGLAAFGAEVILCGRTPSTLQSASEEINTRGGNTWWQVADVSNESDISALLDTVIEKAGRIDILINNAGINPIYRSAEATNLNDWKAIVDTNLTGLFMCCKAFGSEMIKQGSGSIVNITSIAGHVGLRKSVPYCAAKGGVELATRAMALDWAQHKVRVNAIAPAFFETDLTAGMRDHAVLSQRLLDQTPLERFGRPDDLIGAIIYLASAASSYVTGQSIVVDGGWTAQ